MKNESIKQLEEIVKRITDKEEFYARLDLIGGRATLSVFQRVIQQVFDDESIKAMRVLGLTKRTVDLLTNREFWKGGRS